LLVAVVAAGRAADGNRLTYLDERDPYYVSRTFPRLITPQWVGEPGVQAVVILAIDDMRDPERYEAFLRPVLRRLQQIDGRAPVSIMTNQVDPRKPRLQSWLKEGLSLETHTLDHPCPLLQGGDLARAKANYDRCVDLLSAVPGNRPMAFRMPCCDSLNTQSPRFFNEIFNQTTPSGGFLSIDSSVFNVFTSNDPHLPGALVQDADGTEKFRKYVPYDRSFVNTVEDYPYPYVIGRLCWEFPCVTPSDWQADHLHRSANPITVRDWKAALDATVVKQGVFCLVFHPHGWIRSDQLVELIDHAVTHHGTKVKFLTFREAQERLDRNLLGGQPLRTTSGRDNGVRLLDLDNDGYLDVVIGNERVRQTRRWSPQSRAWSVTDFPIALASAGQDTGARFGIVQRHGLPALLVRNDQTAGAWQFDGTRWIEHAALLSGLELEGQPLATSRHGRDTGVRLRDLDGDGCCEVIAGRPGRSAAFARSGEKGWSRQPFSLPDGTSVVDESGKDAGLRFVDIDEDGRDDVIVSNERGYALYLFSSMQQGWSRKVLGGPRGEPGSLPLISQGGQSAGAWFHSRHLWVQNEHTALLADHVDRRSFNQMLETVDPTAKTPAAALAAMRPRPGFVVELMAAEPLVQNPIAFAWGADGKLWVVEMGDYPLGVDGKGKAGGRVKFLESTRGDGKYDKATLFLDGLHFPTGVLPWGKGIMVACAPEIFYAEDTDGDGRADVRRPLYTGFVEGNPQHRVNGLVWGLDNWVYVANGDSGGRVRSVKTGTVLDIRGRDLRIRPDDGALDVQIGQTQYGRGRDDWGDWFGCNNSNPLWHFALADQYLRRNPHYAPPDPRVSVSVTPGASRVYPVSRTLPRFNDPGAANHFTSACSGIIYRDELFGPAFAGNSFVSEPVHNLIHREIVAPRGSTVTSHRAADEQRSEFLASSDNWFRPTMIQTGPDGALWVSDMYRQVIEHPEWIPKDWQKRLDLRAGHDKGRIYRIYPVGAALRAVPRLDRLDTAGLVAALDHPNGWQRDTAQRLLVHRRDPGAGPLLEKLAMTSPRPLARLHALCTLDGLQAVTAPLLLRALRDPHPGVRRHAVRLSEPLLAHAPELGAELLKRVSDADAQVRLQLAYSLGQWPDARAGRALAQLALEAGDDRYLGAAVMSSVNAHNLEDVLLGVLSRSGHAPPGALVDQLAHLAEAFNSPHALAVLLNAVATPRNGSYAVWQFNAVASLLDTLDQQNSSLPQLRRTSSDELHVAIDRLGTLFAFARKTIGDGHAPQSTRLAVIRLLGRGLDRQGEDVIGLAGLLVPQVPDDLQAAAVTALGRLANAHVPDILLRGWKTYSPRLRARVFEVLFRREDWLKAVLHALQTKEILPAEIDAPRRQRLLEHKTAAIRDQAGRLLAGAVNHDRQKVIDAYRGALTLPADARRGGAVFARICAACHILGSVGHAVGPDLASVGDKSPEGLLTAILDPNRAVEARYLNYSAITKNGLTLTGVVETETSTSVTLVEPEGKRHVLLRAELEELICTGRSAMPEGLEKDVQPQDLADLIAHIRGNLPQGKRRVFAGNQPTLVRPGADGSLTLLANTCEIYGSTVVLESQYGNLGWWSSEDDQALWTIEPSRAGLYDVWLNWACANATGANAYVVQAADQRLSGQVEGTGDWDTYRRAKIGKLELRAGRQQIVFRSGGPIKGALIDLKAIQLVPLSAK
jgi:putative membrane-bound dehydrogenase-like protein